jgi:hypothetical protein
MAMTAISCHNSRDASNEGQKGGRGEEASVLVLGGLVISRREKNNILIW